MPGLYRVRAVVEYDGTAYKGFQIQPHDPTIQGALEKALDQVTHEGARVTGSGRTDAGVHAVGQVVHVDTAWRHELAPLQRAWNANLPFDIVIKSLELAAPGFHARFSATSREYRYAIYRDAVASPLVARYSYHHPAPLDLGAMSTAAELLCGEHDMGAFGTPPWGSNRVRTVHRALFEAADEMLYFDITANAFLKRMVRLTLGTLLLVGSGKLRPDEFRDILLSGNLNHPVAAVPPQGLCLVRVNYPG